MWSLSCLILSAVLVGYGQTAESNPDVIGNTTDPLKIVTIDFEFVEHPLIVTIFILFTAIFMTAYHHTGPLQQWIPETCVLLVLGIGFAALFKATHVLENFEMESRNFMLFLLPPIVTDAAYQLHRKAFVSNVGTILLYAVVGTVLNFFFIGGGLYGFSKAGLMGDLVLTPIDAFLYASIIIAVDPVAVIGIFKAVGVNDQLYFMVFGESLFNDAVTIIVFELMASFTFADSIAASDIGLAIGAFFVHSVGAAILGLLVAILSAFVCKFTKGLPIVQPLTVYLFGYLAYLLCTLIDWSGIIGLSCCCIAQTQLAFQNMSPTSHTTLITGAAVLGTIVEEYVFFLMGAEAMRVDHAWNIFFILWVILLCLIGRIMSVGVLNAAVNPFREVRISFSEQFIMWWAGLRGALAFALTTTINPFYVNKNLYITTTLMFIAFTVFIMGIAMRPMVKWFKIETKKLDMEMEDVNVDGGHEATPKNNHEVKAEAEVKTTDQEKRTKLSKYLYQAGYKMQKALSTDKLPKENEVVVAPSNSVSEFTNTAFDDNEDGPIVKIVQAPPSDEEKKNGTSIPNTPIVNESYDEKF